MDEDNELNYSMKLNMEQQSQKQSYIPESSKVIKALYLSSDAANAKILNTAPLLQLFTIDSVNQFIVLTEECEFDLIVIDYFISNLDTLALLEFVKHQNILTENSQIIIITETNDHVTNELRDEILVFGSKVLSVN